MASVFETILSRIPDQNTCFVFPSETTAAQWARKICLHSSVRSLTPERFIAWDTFKEASIRANEKDKRPVSSLIRRLFAFSLARQNAASPFLSALIPPTYAASGEVFANSIAMILGSLGRWEELQNSAGRDDEEDRDLRIIKSKYAAFLQEHDLFEPAWEKAPFLENKNKFVVFFPETLEDFSEYAELLNNAAVTLYSINEFSQGENPAEKPPEKPPLLFFDSARQEITGAVLELRRLHEQGLPYEDMAVTLPDYQNSAPYFERELILHDIPFNRRAGKGLGLYPIGRLFSLIGQCSAALFSFDTLKPLLLDSSIPWKHPEKNRALINYGIANHCVAPFTDRSRIVDAWEEGFKRNPNEELSAYYQELKQNMSALCSAKTFTGIRDTYRIFRSLLDMKKCSTESDAVLARCIEELSVLIETEAAFPDLVPTNPLDFFISYLRDKNYVYAQTEGGVNLYDYPVAAGAPFGCHVLLNVSQAAAAVQHRPLPFLRQDKRARLGIEDLDTSAPVLALYNIAPWKDYTCHTRISASEKTFAGWAIPHSVFALNFERRNYAAAGTAAKSSVEATARTTMETAANPAADPADLFATERQWRAGQRAKPERLYTVQREGFQNWVAILQSQKNPASNESPMKTEDEIESGFRSEVETLLRERIRSKNIKGNNPATAAAPTEFSVSATDLNEFFTCSALWLYRRIFRLERYLEDAALLDDEARGLIYHEILCRIFEHIKETDKRFKKENLANYFSATEEITKAVLRSDDTLRGPLVYPLLAPLAETINKKLRWLLETEAVFFDGYEVKELEQRYDLIQGHLRLTGRIDRVSLSPDGPMIIDYKSNTVPARKHCRKENAGIGLLDFQIPMYIKLYEASKENSGEASVESSGTKVNRAFFISIGRREIVPVTGELQGKRDLCSREDYQPAMDALEEGINLFDTAVTAQDFAVKTIPYKTCPSCEFRTMCRSLYSLNSRNGAGGGGEE